MIFRKYLICILMFVLLVSTVSPNFAFAAKGGIGELQKEVKAPKQIGKKSYFIKLKSTSSSDDFIKNKKINSKKHKKIKKSNTLVMELTDEEFQNLKRNSSIAYIEPNASVNKVDDNSSVTGVTYTTGSITEDQSSVEDATYGTEPTSLISGQINQTDLGALSINHWSVTGMTNDTETIPWGLYAINGQETIDDQPDDQPVRVAVLDTGVADHPDLVVAGGVSFVEGSQGYTDDNGHGTHVSGTIAAKRNANGITGVSQNTELYAVKVLDSFGSGTYDQVVQGIYWAIDNNMNIINMSFGGSSYSQALHDAIIDATNHGILVIAASGNNGFGNETEVYPAKFPEVVSVGAITKSNHRAYFSSTGANIGLVAPGTEILSTIPGGGYASSSGSSMAAPHVTGAAAVLWSHNKTFTSLQIRDLLYTTATPLGNAQEYGHGLINLDRALGINNNDVLPIETVDYYDTGDTSFVPSNSDVQVLGTGLLLDHIYIVPGFPVTASLTLFTDQTQVTATVKNASGSIVATTNLGAKSKGTVSYIWQTLSTTSAGQYTISFSYANNPYVDTFPALTVQSATSINPNSSNNGTISGVSDVKFFKVRPVSNGIMSVQLSMQSSSTNLDVQAIGTSGNLIASGQQSTGLPEYISFNATNTSDYIIKVYSLSGASSYTLTLAVNTAPSTPTNLTTTNIQSSQATLNWSGVSGATSYQLQKNGVNIGTIDSSITSYTFTGLQPKTAYTLGVAAINSGGTSPFASKNATTQTSLISPTAIIITNTVNSLTASWNSVSGANGYMIKLNDVSYGTITSNSYTFTNLISSTNYKFEVAATNGSETSSYATFSQTTLSDTIAPSKPTNLTSPSKTDTSVSLSWTASTDNVGVTGYDVYNGSTKLNTANITGTSYTVTGLIANTTYSFTVKAKDAVGNLSSASNVMSIITNGRVLPVIGPPIDSPTNGQTLSGNSPIVGWIVDGAGVSRVEVMSDNISQGQATYSNNREDVYNALPAYNNHNAGFSYNLDTSKLSNGNHTLSIRETANNGVQTMIGTRIVTINNLSTLTLDSPFDVQTTQGSYKGFSFTPTDGGKYRIFTSPYAGASSGTSDTYLQLFSNSQLTNQLQFDDNGNGNNYSEITYDFNRRNNLLY